MKNKRIVDFQALQIKLASPEEIKSWSWGEVLEPETINYRTLKPVKNGLFCEKIFGPTRDWQCYCGKYKGIRYRGVVCDRCGVEVTRSQVRRERMGHIELAAPVAHVWFFKNLPSILPLFLGIKTKDLEAVIYFAKYLVLKVDRKKRKEALLKLKKSEEQRKKKLKKQLNQAIVEKKKEGEQKIKEVKKKIKDEEQRELAFSEVRLKNKQEIASLQENYENEKQTVEDFYQTLQDKVKDIQRLSVLSDEEYLGLEARTTAFFEAEMGAEAILKVLEELDIEELIKRLKKKAQATRGKKKTKIRKKLRIIEGVKEAGIDPSWIILRILPVIPPDLRPMVQLSGGRFATSDLNDLYRRIVNRNNRLKDLMKLGAPDIILRNEKRMLQESVDALIDAGKMRQRRGEELRSLADILKGKKGRFRRNLLGKRVDYSGRSVIVPGPQLQLDQCGLPKEVALEMFKPYVLRELIARGLAPNVRNAKDVLERRRPEVFDILEEITQKHPVLLNRAPTLHKLGIQAFYPVLTEGEAIQIHPCVCTGFNADFDGDQMAVHLPLSQQAQEEAEKTMLPNYNLLKPADGSPITVPNKGMALGIYYLTSLEKTQKLQESKRVFADSAEAILAYQTKTLNLREKIKVRMEGEIVETSVGRLIFNQALPESFPFINRAMTAGEIKKVVKQALDSYPRRVVISLIDKLKALGFNLATRSGLSVAVSDCKISPQKKKIIDQANKKVTEIEDNFKKGLITQSEKRRLSNNIWLETTEELAKKTWQRFGEDNPVKMIIDSGGTRASKDQVKQLSAMRGLVVDPLGNIVELPTKANFREGFSIFEYVTSARGSRKGLTDSALKTADAGYLTRRLVDATQDVIVREKNCRTHQGIKIKKEGKRGSSFFKRLLGRSLAKEVADPANGKMLFKRNTVVDEEKLEKIAKKKVKEVIIRSPLTCRTKYGVCARCYGWDMGTREMVEIGTPVGVIAAQSIGEPGTQLTLQVKHAGGIVGLDVTQGLPRVEELFEARVPKVLSPVAEITGKAKVKETEKGYQVKLVSQGIKPVEEREYLVPLTSTLRVEEDQLVAKGEQLASGGLEIDKVLQTRGLRGAQHYLIGELQGVYESQGISINDKHFEVVVREMSKRVRVVTPGGTSFLPRELVSQIRFKEESEKVPGQPAKAQRMILGITKAALYTESWLSAASFQRTAQVLTKAALAGEIDPLLGLKENVIIGRLIPTSEGRAKIEGDQNAYYQSTHSKRKKKKKKEGQKQGLA